MIRLAVLADIHGNLPALQAVIDDLARYDVDQVVVAGDSVNCGPFSRQVMETIFDRRWPLVRGNNAFYALDFATGRAPKHWASFTLPPFLRAQLGANWLNTLACLPDTLELRFPSAAPIRVFHGIPSDPFVAINPNSSRELVTAWLEGIAESTIIAAHSHIPMERHIDRWHIFNPGSVGAPLDGDHSASYMILDGDHQGWELHAHRRLAYDRAPLFDEFERQRFVERCGVTARLLIDEFRCARLRLYPYLIWKQQHHAHQPDSLELYDEFGQLHDICQYIPPAYNGLTNALHRD